MGAVRSTSHFLTQIKEPSQLRNMSDQLYIRNPKTGRYIKKNSKRANEELSATQQRRLSHKKSAVSMPVGHSPTKEHGCSAAKTNKYADVPDDLFCGKAGGSCPRTYPIDTKERWRAAKAYARFAPNPDGVKECADAIARKMGWL